MLFRELLKNELQTQSAGFRRFADERAGDLSVYLERLKRVCDGGNEKTISRLEYETNCGAVPSAEVKSSENFCFGFSEEWGNHEEARAWAFEILKNRTTFAADGSQLFIEREVSLPVAAVQIGWFENPHNDAIGYEKQARFFVVPPDELLSSDEPLIPETLVGQKRFEAEVDKASEFLEKKRGWTARCERMPLAFYDGTFLLSMPLPKSNLEIDYIRRLVELMRLSRDAEVPIVGFVDRSYARDLLTMLDTLKPGEARPQKTLDDASILHASPVAMNRWGDRTVFCYSKRRGMGAFTDEHSGKSLVGFTYIQTTAAGTPARVDIPSWVYEKNLLDEVIDVVRAECVVGLGYPYPLETADQTAVISMYDRDIFLRALQDFAVREKLDFSVSRKAASKGRRR
jgi:NurA domain